MSKSKVTVEFSSDQAKSLVKVLKTTNHGFWRTIEELKADNREAKVEQHNSTQKNKDDRLTARTIKIIEKNGRILLKSKSGWYLSAWTPIEAGPDNAGWCLRKRAMEIFNLKWAFALAKLYECKVFVVYSKKKVPV